MTRLKKLGKKTGTGLRTTAYVLQRDSSTTGANGSWFELDGYPIVTCNLVRQGTSQMSASEILQRRGATVLWTIVVATVVLLIGGYVLSIGDGKLSIGSAVLLKWGDSTSVVSSAWV